MKKITVFATIVFALSFSTKSFAQMDERVPGLYAIVGEQSIPLTFTNGTVHNATTGVLAVEVGKNYCTFKEPTSGVIASDTFVMVIDLEKKAIVKTLKSYFPFVKSMTPNNLLILPLSVEKNKRIYEEGKTINGINVSVKDRMDFEWEQISDNSFEIHVQGLIPGEYGIVFRPARLGEFDYSAIFGFSIAEE